MKMLHKNRINKHVGISIPVLEWCEDMANREELSLPEIIENCFLAYDRNRGGYEQLININNRPIGDEPLITKEIHLTDTTRKLLKQYRDSSRKATNLQDVFTQVMTKMYISHSYNKEFMTMELLGLREKRHTSITIDKVLYISLKMKARSRKMSFSALNEEVIRQYLRQASQPRNQYSIDSSEMRELVDQAAFELNITRQDFIKESVREMLKNQLTKSE